MKKVYADRGKVNVLGRRGEHLARCIIFDIADWQATYGEGTVQLLVQRRLEESPYPCVVTVRDGTVQWDVRDVDVAVPGNGGVELQYRVGDAVVKSERYRTLTLEAMADAGPVPSAPEQSWVEQVLKAARDAEQSAQDAREAVGRTVTMGENGNWLIDGEDTGVRATGPQGEQGEVGPAGPQGIRGETGLPAVLDLQGATQSLVLANNTDYRCMDAVTSLSVTGFESDPTGRTEAWSIRFTAGAGIVVKLPGTVVWNFGAAPKFTSGNEYHLLFAPLLSGKVLGVWNEVEA